MNVNMWQVWNKVVANKKSHQHPIIDNSLQTVFKRQFRLKQTCNRHHSWTKCIGFNIAVNTLQAIQEASLSSQSLALILKTKPEKPSKTCQEKHRKNTMHTIHTNTRHRQCLPLDHCRSQWSSSSMPDCSARGPGIELRCGQGCNFSGKIECRKLSGIFPEKFRKLSVPEEVQEQEL